MIICPHCKEMFAIPRIKKSQEQKKKMRTSLAWNKANEILKDYNNGDAIMWLVRKYKADKRTIRTILKESGIISFRGRKGIQAWNKGKDCPQLQGKNNWNWKGGIGTLNMQIRRCGKYNQWRKDIMIRDNYTCQICKKRGGDLEVDHYPKRFATIMKENNIKSLQEAKLCIELWDSINNRTLCLICHNKTKSSLKNTK